MILFDGDLELTSGAQTISIVARGTDMSVALDGDGVRSLRAFGALARSRRTVRRIAAAFVANGSTLTVTRGATTLLRLGRDVETGTIGKILGIANVSVFRGPRT